MATSDSPAFLIVDDSAVTRSMIRRSIEMSGVNPALIDQASNGREALTRMAEQKFDLVFLDLNMPEMNGIECAGVIRRDPNLRTSVVVVSSESMASRVEQLKHEGVRGYIKKPFTPEQIRQVIEEILEVRDAA